MKKTIYLLLIILSACTSSKKTILVQRTNQNKNFHNSVNLLSIISECIDFTDSCMIGCGRTRTYETFYFAKISSYTKNMTKFSLQETFTKNDVEEDRILGVYKHSNNNIFLIKTEALEKYFDRINLNKIDTLIKKYTNKLYSSTHEHEGSAFITAPFISKFKINRMPFNKNKLKLAYQFLFPFNKVADEEKIYIKCIETSTIVYDTIGTHVFGTEMIPCRNNPNTVQGYEFKKEGEFIIEFIKQ